MLYYFAYGSNLHPVRLTERVASAELLGVAEYSGHKLAFHKQGQDGSGKCNMCCSAIEYGPVYGAIYRLKREHKIALDRFEGKGYLDDQIMLQHYGKEYSCFSYFAQQSHIVDNLRPYDWYKQLVMLGAQYLELPGSYISLIEAVETLEDPDLERKHQQQQLIDRIIEYR